MLAAGWDVTYRFIGLNFFDAISTGCYFRSCLKTPSGLRAAAKAPVGVGQTHPYLEDMVGFSRLDRHVFARARELTGNFETASYILYQI